MNRQLVPRDLLLGAGFGDEQFGQGARLAVGDQPTDDVAAEDVEHDVQVVVGPLRRAQQLGNVPTPDLVGAGREQFGLGVGRMAQLIAAFAHFGVLVQHPIHRAGRTQIGAFIQQRGVHFARRLIGKALAVERVMDDVALRGA